MTCHSCARLIEDSLLIHGVFSAAVSFAEKKVEIVYNDSLVNNKMFKKIIEDTEKGKFKATILTDSFKNGKILNKNMVKSEYVISVDKERYILKFYVKFNLYYLFSVF